MIDEQTRIDKSAKIGKNVSIGPWTCIGADVEIGDGCEIGSHVVIKGPSKIGPNNRIFQFSSVGEICQDKKFEGEEAWLEVGEGNTIREHCTLNRGSKHGGGVTKIGDYNWIMANVHIAHDCRIGDHNIFGNNAALAGHVTCENYATISGYSAVHQFCNIGAYSFLAGGTYVNKDILPYILIAGFNASACGLNSVGLRRHGFSTSTIEYLRKAYKIIFRKGLTVQQACVELHELIPECPEIKPFIDSLQASERGIVR